MNINNLLVQISARINSNAFAVLNLVSTATDESIASKDPMEYPTKVGINTLNSRGKSRFAILARVEDTIV